MGTNARWSGHIWAVVAAGAATSVGIAMAPRFDPANIAMVYLLAVVCVASRHGRGAAMLTALLSIAAIDFLFVPPVNSFAMDDAQYLLTYAILLVVALVTSRLADQVHKAAVGTEAGIERIRIALLTSISRDLNAPPPP
jgi:two-component system sensor histidine kinase KdpD